MKKKRYDLIVSLGEDCACTTHLRQNQLQFSSYPFDWLTRASFRERIKAFEDNFQDFLDKEAFAPLPAGNGPLREVRCVSYENTKANFYFYHDFPLNEPFESAFPVVQEKYKRRIARLYERIAQAKTVLFVWFSHATNIPDQDIRQAREDLTAKFGKPIDLLVIENERTLPSGTIEKRAVTPHITRFKMKTSVFDENGFPSSRGLQKDPRKVFRLYGLNEPFFQRFKRALRRRVLRSLIALLPNRNLRRRLRSRYV